MKNQFADTEPDHAFAPNLSSAFRGAAMTAPGGARVFIVDDDEAVRDSLRAMLESEGLEVEEFADGEEFLRLFDPRDTGCVLLDLNMPEVSGHEVLESMAERNIQIPVIVITSVSDDRLKSRALAAGARTLLEKPLEHERLLDTINQVMGDSSHPS